MLFGVGNTCAQNVASYGFSQSAGTYTSITGGTVLSSAGSNWSNDRYTVSLPAPFWFAGQTYSTMYVGSNGFITFGSIMAPGETAPISSSAGYAGVVSPFGTNIQNANSSTSEIRWVSTGGEIVVQWKDAQRKVANNSESFSFQARLNLLNGVVKFVYSGVTNLNNSTQRQPEVGLRGANNTFATNVNNRTLGNGSETWSATLAGTASNNTIRFTNTTPARSPSAGQTYTFTPALCPPTVTISASPGTTVCAGTAVTFNAVSSYGGPSPTYWWSVNGASAGTGTSITLSAPSNGDIVSVLMTSSASCAFPNTASSSVTMTVHPLPGLTLTGTTAVCTGTTSVSLGYSAPTNGADQFMLDWSASSNSAGLADIPWTPLSGGTIQLTNLITTSGSYPGVILVRNSSTGCQSDISSSVVCGTVNEGSTLTLNAPSGNVFSSVDFASYGTPTGSCGSFAQSTCHAATSLAVVQAAALGNATFSVTANNTTFGDPCSGTFKRLNVSARSSFRLRIDAVPTGAITGPSVACGGSTITLTAPAGTSYVWNTGATTQSITVNPVGPTSYDVTVSNGSCSASFSQAVTTQAAPGFTLGTLNPIICTGNTTAQVNVSNVVGGADQYAIDWSTTANSAGLNDQGWTSLSPTGMVISGLVNTSGTYYAMIQARNSATGCTSVISGGTICNTVNENQSLSLTAPGGGRFVDVPFASYGTPGGSCGAFTLGTCHSSNSVNTVRTAAVGNSTFSIGANNTVFGDPCSGTLKRLSVEAAYSSFRLTLSPAVPAFSATATVTTPIACNGGNATVQVNATGGLPPYTGTGTFNRPAGTHLFNVTHAGGCTATAALTIGQPTLLTAASNLTTPVSCNGGTATVSITATGGTAPYTGTGTFARTAGTWSFTVTDANSCSTTISTSVTEPATLNVQSVIDQLESGCQTSDAVVQVSASGGTAPYSGTGANTGLTAGTANLYVTDANNCTASTTIVVPEPDSDGDGTTDCADQCPNDPNKTDPGACGCDAIDTDTDGDGAADCEDACPNDPAKQYPGSCGCGFPESDADADGYADCVDGCPNDPNKIASGTCGCGVADTDIDADGIPDCIDPCPYGPSPGTACDDGDASTTNDIIGTNCQCHGTAGPSGLVLSLTTDGNAAQTSWSLTPSAGGAPLCSGSGYANNQTIDISCTTGNGSYVLRVMDNAGDGMCCNNGTGGYVLRTSDGERIIDNSGDGIFASLSSVSNGFTLPLGNDRLTPSRCDREDLLPNDFIQAVPNSSVQAQYGTNNTNSGYQFWFFDPDGGYSRRMLVTHATGSYLFPGGPDRCSYLRLSDVITDPVPQNVLLNVRVRSMVNGVYSEFGPACRLKVDLPGNCPVTQLLDDVNDPRHSCGAENVMLDGSRWLYAAPVSTANKYQFKFTSGGYERSITSPGSGLLLTQWVQLPLEYGTKDYQVRVRVSFDNGTTWCPFGPPCTITTAASAPVTTRSATVVGSDLELLRIWPNPSMDGAMNISLTGLHDEDGQVFLHMIDLRGRTVFESRTTPIDGEFNVQLKEERALPPGAYLISLRTERRSWTQRVVVE